MIPSVTSAHEVTPLFKKGSRSKGFASTCESKGCKRRIKKTSWVLGRPFGVCAECAVEAERVWASALAPQCNQCRGGLLAAADGVVAVLRCDGCAREVPASAMTAAA